MRAASLTTMALAIAVLSIAAPTSRADLLVNGNFEAGNTGFSVSNNYSYLTSGFSGPGHYGVIKNPATTYTDGFASYGDHTTGSGLQLFVDGAPQAGSVFWSEAVTVVANSNYTFTGYAAEALAASPADIQLYVNGIAVGSDLNLSGALLGIFKQTTTTFNSGSATSLTVSLVDLNLVGTGNDFTVDDLSLVGPSPFAVPEPSSLVLVGIGAAGLIRASRRRRRAKMG